MYKTFGEAKAAALDAIEKVYSGNKMGCVVSENKLNQNSRKTSFNFRFNSEDTNGKFIKNDDGSYSKLTAI